MYVPVAAHPRFQPVRARLKFDFIDVLRPAQNDDITLRGRTFAKQRSREVPARLGVVFGLDSHLWLEQAARLYGDIARRRCQYRYADDGRSNHTASWHAEATVGLV